MIEKFRLDWRSNTQAQYDELQKMVMHLSNIANSMTDINIKLNVLPQIVTAINNQGLLLQAIADNTACACNGISQVNDNLVSMHKDMNDKLDYIAELLEGMDIPVPAPVFVFNLFTTSIDITPEIINAGSFILSGVSTKDGEVFDQIILVDEYDFIDSVNVISDTQIEIQLVPGAAIPEGTLVIQLKQDESNIVQQFSMYYQAPPVPVLNFVRLDDGTIVPLTSPAHVASLCTTGVASTSITIGTHTFTKYSVKEVCIVDGSLLTNNTIPGNFCREFSALGYLTIPETVTAIGEAFLLKCTSFNQPLTLPKGLLSIGSDFLNDCTAYNSDIALPEGLKTIDVYFMNACKSFARPLTLPDLLTSVGGLFMYNTDAFTGPLNIGRLTASVFSLSPTGYSLCTGNANAVAYTSGISVLGNDSNAFRTRFPNRSTNPYRNLLPYGIVPTPNKLDFASAGGKQTIKLTSTLPWFYARYWDDQGQAHEGVLPDWLQIDILSGPHGTFTLAFTVTENTGSKPRYASLDFSTNETASGVVVSQEAFASDRHFWTRLIMDFPVNDGVAKVNTIINVKTAQKQYEFINSVEYPSGHSSKEFNFDDLIPSTDTTPIAWVSVNVNGNFQASVASFLADDNGFLQAGDTQYGSLYYAGPVVGNLRYEAHFTNV